MGRVPPMSIGPLCSLAAYQVAGRTASIVGQPSTAWIPWQKGPTYEQGTELPRGRCPRHRP